jgi:predicted ester cyclase
LKNYKEARVSDPLELAEEWLDKIWRRGILQAAEQLCAVNYTDYTLPESDDGDIVQFQDYARDVLDAFGNLQVELADSYEDVDYAILRVDWRANHRAEYLEVAATQKTIEWSSIEILHVEANKISERWAQNDLLAQLLQASESARDTDFGALQRETEQAALISQLAEIPNQLRAAVRAGGVHPSTRDTWSTAAVIGHLWRAERNIWQARLEQIRNQDEPYFDFWEPDRAACEEQFGAADVNVLLDAFEFLRNATCDYLRGLSDQEWERRGVRRTLGDANVAELMQEALQHDRECIATLAGAQL